MVLTQLHLNPDGTVVGQLKVIIHDTDGGTTEMTPVSTHWDSLTLTSLTMVTRIC